MKKSITDINEQAERVIRLAENSQRFRGVSGKVCKQAIYQLARKTKSQHGFSIFETDKDEKRECLHPYVLRVETFTPWWQREEYVAKPIIKPQAKERQKPLTDEERQKYEVKLNDLCNHQMKNKVLAWIAADMTLKTNLGLPGDPFEIPQWLKETASHFLNMRKKKQEQKIVQLTLF